MPLQEIIVRIEEQLQQVIVMGSTERFRVLSVQKNVFLKRPLPFNMLHIAAHGKTRILSSRTRYRLDWMYFRGAGTVLYALKSVVH